MTTPATSDVSILFFGDMVGKPGRQAIAQYLRQQAPEEKADIVIANGENATHGFGLQENHYNELLESGVDIITSGNHIWDRKDILHYMSGAEKLLRPNNMPASMPGSGVKTFTINGVTIGVINLIGQVFMANYNAPWEGLDAIVKDLKKETNVIFLDFHAEATAEKLALGHYASQLGVSAMVGTHTHVQTADDQLFTATANDHQMGYITDAGFNGTHHSVIGMSVDTSLMRMKSLVPTRLEVAEGGNLQVNAVRFTVNKKTGACTGIQRVYTVVAPAPIAV